MQVRLGVPNIFLGCITAPVESLLIVGIIINHLLVAGDLGLLNARDISMPCICDKKCCLLPRHDSKCHLYALQADSSRELEYRAGEEEPRAPHAEPKQAQPGNTPGPKPGEAGRDESAAEDEEGAGDGHVNEAEQEQFEDRTFAAPQVFCWLVNVAVMIRRFFYLCPAFIPLQHTSLFVKQVSPRLCCWPSLLAASFTGTKLLWASDSHALLLSSMEREN